MTPPLFNLISASLTSKLSVSMVLTAPLILTVEFTSPIFITEPLICSVVIVDTEISLAIISSALRVSDVVNVVNVVLPFTLRLLVTLTDDKSIVPFTMAFRERSCLESTACNAVISDSRLLVITLTALKLLSTLLVNVVTVSVRLIRSPLTSSTVVDKLVTVVDKLLRLSDTSIA